MNSLGDRRLKAKGEKEDEKKKKRRKSSGIIL
jgi:hypothetical protein